MSKERVTSQAPLNNVSQSAGRSAAKWAARLADDRWFEPARAYLLSLGGEGLEAAMDAFANPSNRQMHENAGHLISAFGPDAVPLVMAYLATGTGVFTMSTAALLGSIGDPRAVDELIRLLGHKSPFTRWAALKALRRIGDPRALGPAMRRLRDRAHFPATEAVRIVGQMADESAIPELERPMSKPSIAGQPGIMAEAAAAIQSIRSRAPRTI
jgi:HEAT repeat protein